MKEITLKSGVKMPKIGLGTFDISEEKFSHTIIDACKSYRQLLCTRKIHQAAFLSFTESFPTS